MSQQNFNLAPGPLPDFISQKSGSVPEMRQTRSPLFSSSNSILQVISLHIVITLHHVAISYNIHLNIVDYVEDYYFLLCLHATAVVCPSFQSYAQGYTYPSKAKISHAGSLTYYTTIARYLHCLVNGMQCTIKLCMQHTSMILCYASFPDPDDVSFLHKYSYFAL